MQNYLNLVLKSKTSNLNKKSTSPNKRPLKSAGSDLRHVVMLFSRRRRKRKNARKMRLKALRKKRNRRVLCAGLGKDRTNHLQRRKQESLGA